MAHKLLRIINDGRNRVVVYLDETKGRQEKRFPLATENSEIQAFIAKGISDDGGKDETPDDGKKKSSKNKQDDGGKDETA